MTNGIRFEHQHCKNILDGYLKSLKPYTDAFFKGRSVSLVRQVRKVTWIFRRDDIKKLERDLEGHLKALQMYTEAFFQIQMASNTHNTNDILARIVELRLDITNISNILQLINTPVPAGLGYSCGPDNISLLDAVGRKVLLPIMLLSSPTMLHKTLLLMYQGIPGRRKILRKEYTISDEDSDGIILDESNWNKVICRGKELSLNMILPSSSSWNMHSCPRCDEPSIGTTLPGQRKRCHKCQLTFRIFDQERVFEELESLSLKTEEEEDRNSKSTKPTRPTSNSHFGGLTSKSKRDIRSEKNEDFYFTQVHFHRQIPVTKNIPTEVVPEEEKLREFVVEELPPLHKAAALGSISDIDKILDKGVDIDAPMPYKVRLTRGDYFIRLGGCSPLQLAAFTGKLKAIPRIFCHSPNSRGAESNVRDVEGYTTFHYACCVGAAWSIHLPLEHGADLESKNEFGFTPLHLGAQFGRLSVVEILLDSCADHNDRNNKSNFTPLHLAVQHESADCEAVTRALLDHGSNMTLPDKDGDTALHLSCYNQQISAVNLLLARGADISLRNYSGETPLHKTIWASNKEIVQLLLEQGADVNALDKDLWSPLHIASHLGHHATANILLENGASVEAVEKLCGRTSLHLASSSGKEEIVGILLRYGADINAVDHQQRTALHFTSKHVSEGISMILLQHGAHMNAKDEDGCTPLMDASHEGNENLVKWLLDNGANINAVDVKGETAMHHASSMGHERIAEILLQHVAAIDARNVDGKTPLFCDCAYGKRNIARLLLDHGADATIVTVQGLNDVDWSLRRNVDQELLELFLGNEAVRVYLRHNSTINRQDERGRTALHRACFRGQESVVKLLIDLGAKDSEDNEGNFPLHDAADNGNEAVIKLLLAYGSNPNVQAKDGAYPIHWATINDHLGALKLLTYAGADINAQDAQGHTAFVLASMVGSIDALHFLMRNGCIPSDEDLNEFGLQGAARKSF